MPLDAKEKEIDGVVFRYQPMRATPARELLDELIQRFGPSVGAAIKGIQAPEGMSMDDDIGGFISGIGSAIGSGVSGFSSAMDPKFHTKLVNQLGATTLIDTDCSGNFVPFTPEVRDMLFGTKLATEWKWILYCLEVQYGDFLDSLRKVATDLTGTILSLMTESGLTSQKDSTGQSTESPLPSDTPAD